jgi:hypothetical protein
MTPLYYFLRNALATLLFVWPGLGMQAANPSADRGTVALDIVDAFGSSVPPTWVKIAGPAGVDFSPKPPIGSAQSLPYGDYNIRVFVPGFDEWRGVLHVRQPETRLTVGMQLGAIDGPKPGCSLHGRVEARGRPVPTFVRLLPVFANEIFEADVASSGAFTLAGVGCGAYVLTVVRDGRVVNTTPVELTGTTEPLTVHVGSE